MGVFTELLDNHEERLDNHDKRLYEHEARLDSLVQTLGNLAADRTADRHDADPAPGTWTLSSSRLPDSYRSLIVDDGRRVMYAVWEPGRWTRCSDGESMCEPRFWMYAPEMPE